MIILDTNVLSEMMKSGGHPQVIAWIDRTPRSRLFTTAVSQGEILSGLAMMPDGRRRDELQGRAVALFSLLTADQILPFDSEASVHYARIAGLTKRRGAIVGAFDMQIAAICCANAAPVATRNVKHFESCGIDVIDPWAA